MPQSNTNQGWGANDQPVSAGDGYGANDTPVSGGPTPETEPGNHGLSEFLTSPHGFIREGLREAGQGVKGLLNPGWDAKAEAAHQIIGGVGKAAIPAVIPFAAAAPLATAGAAALGFGGSRLAGAGAHALGAGPGVEDLAGDVGGALGGGLGSKAGRSVSKVAAPLAESALGIRGAMREHGATPGKAILEDTRGIRPSTIENSAQSKTLDLTNQLETAARQVKSPISLAPARAVADSAINTARSGNSVPNELLPIREHLTIPHKGFGGAVDQPPAPMMPDPNSLSIHAPMVPGPLPPAQIAEKQSPIDYLGMKRRLGTDFTNFRPGTSTPESVDVANRVYGQMARDFNGAVPGGEALNQRIQSLLPVIRRAHAEDLNAGPGERVLNRVTRPTGALAPLLFGFHEGGIPGALATMVGQEGLSSPVVKMLGARALHGSGRMLPGLPAALVGDRTNQ